MKCIPAIIPFFRETQKLEQAVAALRRSSYQPIEVFVRDNSHDNVLFTAAVNEGLRRYCYRADIDFVLVLNHDANVHEEMLERLVAFMSGNPQCGIACPLQVTGPEKTVTWGGSVQAFPFGVALQGSLAGFTASAETYWANGACMLLRTALVREIGVLDQNMRFICSDSDFSFTARARGWKVHVVAGAIVEHGYSGSGAKESPWLARIKIEDALYFAAKWLNGGLYRQLAAEGSSLTAAGIEAEIDRLRAALRLVENAQP